MLRRLLSQFLLHLILQSSILFTVQSQYGKLIISDVKIQCCSSLTVNLIEYFELNGKEGVVVSVNGDVVYKLSKSFNSTTQGSNWTNLNAALDTSFAFYAQIDKNYTGNILQWRSINGDNILRVDIIRESSDSRLLNIQFFNQQSIKFQLLVPSGDFQRLSFTLTNGNQLSVYADCQLLHSLYLLQRIMSPTDDQNQIIIFQDASDSSMPQVNESGNINLLLSNHHFRLLICCFLLTNQ